MREYYYKFNNNNLVVKWIKNNKKDFFTGKVVRIGGSGWKLGQEDDFFCFNDFSEYTPKKKELAEWDKIAPQVPKTPLPEATPIKDVELRLECLRLAIQANCVDPVIAAKEYYEWITKTPNQ